jgi:O-antigen ligase
VLVLLLVATRSRGALFATLAGVLVLVVLTPYRRHRAFSLVTLLGLLAVGLANVGVNAVGAFLARGQSGAQLQQLNGRLEIFEVGVELIGQRPLFGHGYLAGRTVFYDRIWWHPGEAHNVLLEIAVSMGLVGLCVFLALVLTVAGRLLLFRRRPPRPGPGAAAVADIGLACREALAVLVFVLVNGMVAESFISPGYEAAALVLAIVLADCSWVAHHRRRPSAAATATPVRATR